MSEKTLKLRVNAPRDVLRYGVAELVVRVDEPGVENPFTDARLRAEFRSGGEALAVAGFCDSDDGSLWRVRFCPAAPGEYTYALRYEDSTGRAEAAGTMVCTEEAAGHGFVRRDPAHPMHFVHDDGTHVFIAGKTAWRLGSSPVWREFIDQAAASKMNVLRVGVECPYFREQPGGDCWLWGGTREAPDFSRFNLDQWRHWDDVLAYAFQCGVMIEACILTGFEFQRNPRPVPDPDMERYWDYLIARWGAYPGVLLWELYNEFTGQPDFQRYMGRYLHAHDPYERLVTTSAGPIAEEPFPGEGWNDLIVPHYCTGSWMHLDAFYRHYALHHRRHGKPVFVDETGRIGCNQHNVHGNTRRKEYWIWAVSGDYCNYHSEGGCFVTLDQEPAEEDWPHLVSFWEATEWWRMTPFPEPLNYQGAWQVRAYGLAAPDAAIGYLCTLPTFAGSGLQMGLEAGAGVLAMPMRPGRYLARWYSPVSGTYSEAGPVVSDGTLRLEVPPFKDDLALRIDEQP